MGPFIVRARGVVIIATYSRADARDERLDGAAEKKTKKKNRLDRDLYRYTAHARNLPPGPRLTYVRRAFIGKQ